MTFIVVSQLANLPVFSFLPLPIPLAYVLVMAWSAVGVAFMVPQQILLVARSPERQPVILAFNSTANYLGAAAGAGLGGLVVAHAGLDWLGIAATLLASLAALNLLGIRMVNSRSEPLRT